MTATRVVRPWGSERRYVVDPVAGGWRVRRDWSGRLLSVAPYAGWCSALVAIQADSGLDQKTLVRLVGGGGKMPPDGTPPPLGFGRTAFLTLEGEGLYETDIHLGDAVRNGHTVTSGASVNAIRYYDWVRFRNLTLDANSQSWTSEISASFYGVNKQNANRQKYVGFRHWHFEEVCLVNGPIPIPNHNEYWLWFQFGDWQVNAMEGDPANPSQIFDIKVSGLRRPPDGSPAGGYGLAHCEGKVTHKTGPFGTGANCRADELLFEDGYYDSGADTVNYGTKAGGGGIWIGNWAVAGRVRIRDFVFAHCADIPLVTQNCEDCVVERVTGIESHGLASNVVREMAVTPRTVYRDCRQILEERKVGVVGWNLGNLPSGLPDFDQGVVRAENCFVRLGPDTLFANPRAAVQVHSAARYRELYLDIEVDDAVEFDGTDARKNRPGGQVNGGLFDIAGGTAAMPQKLDLIVTPYIHGSRVNGASGYLVYPLIDIRRGFYGTRRILIRGANVTIGGDGLRAGDFYYVRHSPGTTNEEDLIVADTTQGVFTVTVEVVGGAVATTPAPGIARDASEATVKAALEALATVGGGMVDSVTRATNEGGDGYNWDVVFNVAAGGGGQLVVSGRDGVPVAVAGAANNGAGLIRLSTGAAHGLATGDTVKVERVAGTTEANGSWTATVIDATHVDLQGSVFAHAYVSGGLVSKRTFGNGTFDVFQVHPGHDRAHESGDCTIEFLKSVGIDGAIGENWDADFDLIGPCYARGWQTAGAPVGLVRHNCEGARPDLLEDVGDGDALFSLVGAG